MYPVYEVAAVREAEQFLMAGLPPHTLMQRAAFGLAGVVAEVLRDRTGKVAGTTVVGLIGPGNNGSDTLLAMSYLARRGVRVAAVDVTGKRTADHTDEAFNGAFGQWWSVSDVTARSSQVDVLLDGIAGLGSSRALTHDVADLVELVRHDAAVVAVDVPSGIDVDTAVPFEPHRFVNADVTVAFGCLKPCHVLDPAADICGEVRLVTIGLESFESAPHLYLVDDHYASSFFDGPSMHHNKYSRGVVGVVAGAQYPGAGLLAVRAARWGGAGLVRQVGADFTEELATVVHHPKLTKKVSADAWVVGPGLGSAAPEALEKLIDSDASLVIDADALNALGLDKELRKSLRKRKALSVLTPHGGEARRLAEGYDIAWSDEPAELARRLAKASKCVVYLKGSVGVVATPTGVVYATQRTTEHLATAGSGDVLAGLVGSLLAADRPSTADELAERVAAAIIAHSRAAELIALDGGPVIASDIEENLPAAIADLTLGL